MRKVSLEMVWSWRKNGIIPPVTSEYESHELDSLSIGYAEQQRRLESAYAQIHKLDLQLKELVISAGLLDANAPTDDVYDTRADAEAAIDWHQESGEWWYSDEQIKEHNGKFYL